MVVTESNNEVFCTFMFVCFHKITKIVDTQHIVKCFNHSLNVNKVVPKDTGRMSLCVDLIQIAPLGAM